MKILFTAQRELNYNRVLIILEGLRAIAPTSYKVFQFSKRDAPNATKLRSLAGEADLIYIPPFRHKDVRWVRANVGGKPILFDALVSGTITRVVDYGWWWRWPHAYLRDQFYFRAADHLLFDTEAHAKWNVSEFGFKPDRCHTLYIGSDTRLFPDRNAGSGSLSALSTDLASVRITGSAGVKVGFYGSLVPLQGIETILSAAEILRAEPTIKFELIGNFDKRPDLTSTLAEGSSINLVVHQRLAFDALASHVSTFDVALGIFGSSDKANIVIPNKVYHYASCGIAIVSRDSTGIREVFRPGHDIVTVPDSDPEALAAAIRGLAADAILRHRIGRNAASMIRASYKAEDVAASFLNICRGILGAKRTTAR